MGIWDRLKSDDSLGLRRGKEAKWGITKETRSASKDTSDSSETWNGMSPKTPLSKESRCGGKEMRNVGREARTSFTERSILGNEYAFQLDDEVEAKYRLDGRWYAATIFKDFGDGSYDVYWHDGDTQDRKNKKAELRL